MSPKRSGAVWVWFVCLFTFRSYTCETLFFPLASILRCSSCSSNPAKVAACLVACAVTLFLRFYIYKWYRNSPPRNPTFYFSGFCCPVRENPIARPLSPGMLKKLSQSLNFSMITLSSSWGCAGAMRFLTAMGRGRAVADALFEGRVRASPCSCCLCKTMLHLLSAHTICPWAIGNQCRAEKWLHCP